MLRRRAAQAYQQRWAREIAGGLLPKQPQASELYAIGSAASVPAAIATLRNYESVALLKNGGRLLPLQSGSRVALVGSACDARNDIDALLRQWNLANYYTIGGSGRTIPLSPASVAAGLRAAWEKRVEYAGEGPFHLPLDPAPPAVEVVNGDHDDNVDLAVAAMERADVAIVCGATTAAESEDRPSLLLDQSGFIG